MNNRILVIDDEESLCEILKFNLEKEGYEVNCAYSAEEALTLDLSVYSLMIVDIMMERLSGFDLQNASATAQPPKPPPLYSARLSTERTTPSWGLISALTTISPNLLS